MQCSFCGLSFEEDACRETCGNCALFGGCRMVKCPRCGYEMPQTPGILKLLRRWSDKKWKATR